MAGCGPYDEEGERLRSTPAHDASVELLLDKNLFDGRRMKDVGIYLLKSYFSSHFTEQVVLPDGLLAETFK